MRITRGLALALAQSTLVAASVLLAAAPVRAEATFTVNSARDRTDASPGDGVCETSPGNGTCTLRAAIMEANALVGADTVVLPGETFTLTIAGSGEDAAATGDLDVTDDVTIVGDGSATTFVTTSGFDDRVFEVRSPSPHPIPVTIRGVTIEKGKSPDVGGGIMNGYFGGDLTLQDVSLTGNSDAQSVAAGLYNYTQADLDGVNVFNNQGPGIYNGAGGSGYNGLVMTDSSVGGNAGVGIANAGGLTLIGSVVDGNAGGGIFNSSGLSLDHVSVTGNSGRLMGGGIANTGLAKLANVTITGNRAGSGGGGGGGGIYDKGGMTLAGVTISGNQAGDAGGGIFNECSAALCSLSDQLTNVTISGNQGGSKGGGLFQNTQAGLLRMVNVTVADNSATQGGGIANANGTPANLTLKNSIVADSQAGGDCSGTALQSAGHNLSSDSSCPFTGPGDRKNTDPKLLALADNGGFTETHALSQGSPAVDKADNNGCPATDQRGVGRPIDGDQDGNDVCDMGAYELNPPGITGFMPTAATVGKAVTILGAGFTGATDVLFFDGTAVELPARKFAVESDTEVKATIPVGALTGPVSVVVPSGTVTSRMDFDVKPKIRSFDPTSGPIGTVVTIRGSAFTGATHVTFGGVEAEFTVDTYSRITATVPHGAATGPIAVTTPGGRAQSAADFMVTG